MIGTELPLGVVVLSALAAGARISMAETEQTPKGICASIITALFLTVATYPYLVELELTQGARDLISATIAFFSRDLLEVGIVLKRQIKEDPLGIIRDFLNWRKSKDD